MATVAIAIKYWRRTRAYTVLAMAIVMPRLTVMHGFSRRAGATTFMARTTVVPSTRPLMRAVCSASRTTLVMAAGLATLSNATNDSLDRSMAMCAPTTDTTFPDDALEYDNYNGVTLHLRRLPHDMDVDEFVRTLESSVSSWHNEGRKGIWLHVPTLHANKIPAAAALGFAFHMVGTNGELLLTKWLPDSPSRLPNGPSHQVGVGCLVLHPDNSDMMLCVQEQAGPAAAWNLWKMPTGLTDVGEDLPEAAARELYEETGLRATFAGIVVFRQAHAIRGSARGTSDLFFVCRMQLVGGADLSLRACPDEIKSVKWMPIDEYCGQEQWQDSPLYKEMNDAIRNVNYHQLFQSHTLPVGWKRGNLTNTLYKSSL